MQTNNETLTNPSDLEQRLLQAIEDLNNARQRETEAERRYLRVGRRARLLGGFAFAVVIGTLALSTVKPVGAQGGYGPTLTSLQNQVNSLLIRTATVETKTQYQYADAGAKATRFVGCNVEILSGSGRTDDNVPNGGTLTGLGNLIIGYNEPRFTDDARSGSHNLVMGQLNNYTSYGGIVAGHFNVLSGPFSSITGGYANTASGQYTSVSGGTYNTASGQSAAVSGGTANTASGPYAAVSGGSNNVASGLTSSVSGGQFNTASGESASAGGGRLNKASGLISNVLGGYRNEAYGSYSLVCGGAFCGAGGSNPNGDFTANLGGFATGIVTQYGHVP